MDSAVTKRSRCPMLGELGFGDVGRTVYGRRRNLRRRSLYTISGDCCLPSTLQVYLFQTAKGISNVEVKVPRIRMRTSSLQEDIICVWNKTASDIATTQRIRDTLRRVLHLPSSASMEYKTHNESLKHVLRV